MYCVIKFYSSPVAIETDNAFETVTEAIEAGKRNDDIEYILEIIEEEEFPKIVYTKDITKLMSGLT